jgi:hypothetical protein
MDRKIIESSYSETFKFEDRTEGISISIIGCSIPGRHIKEKSLKGFT